MGGTFRIDEAAEAYALLAADTSPRPLAILLEYPSADRAKAHTVVQRSVLGTPRGDRVRLGLIGAGQFARDTLIPLLREARDVEVVAVAAATGPSAESAAALVDARYTTTDFRQLLADDSIHAVVIATRHDLHAKMAADALAAGKCVFVEKPLAISSDQLQAVANAHAQSAGWLTVGFNRRFSAHAAWLRGHFAQVSVPVTIVCRVNAGSLPADAWQLDAQEGGGRLIGEACHFVDLAQFLCGSAPTEAFAWATPNPPDPSFALAIKFADGSVATIMYATGGDRAFGKERVEILGGGAAAAIDDFRVAGLTVGGRTQRRSSSQDKGHRAELQAFVAALRTGGPAPVPFAESWAATAATLAAAESLRTGLPVRVGRLSEGPLPADAEPLG